ncbi:TniQ family protein [Paenibacillus oryzisoli]|uniref:TniQ family protein n=1 Tax=Paenibacillus oryzisoli TaxID=1850517 RepID=UPI003D2DE4FB
MTRGTYLPIRLKHFFDESLSGYLFRLFQANHFLPNTDYFKDKNLTLAQLQNNEITNQVMMSICPWIPVTDSNSINNNDRILSFLNDSWKNKLIQNNNLKYCPSCIRENYYHRLEWCILPMKMCPKHFILLRERCSFCKRTLDFFDFIQKRCKVCLFQLKESSLTHIHHDRFADSQSRLFGILMNNTKSNIFQLEKVNYLELVYTSFVFINGCIDFTGYNQEPIDVFYNSKDKIKSSTNLAIAFSNVDWMYSEFPKNLFQVLDLFLSKYKGMRRYDAFQKFELLLRNDCYSALKEAFHSYCIQKLESGVIRRDFGVFKVVPELLQKRKLIRREEVKTEKGVTYGKLSRLQEDNLVLMKQSSKNEYYVDSISLNTYLEEEKRWITKKEASLILGIHASSIESLIGCNLIQSSTNFSGKSKRISLDHLNLLLNRCSGDMVESLPNDYISFHDALIKFNIFNLSIELLIQFALSGLLVPVRQCSVATLRDLYFNNEELKKCLLEVKKRNQNEKGYYFSDLLREFKVGEKRLRRLLEDHDIQPDLVSHYSDGRARYLYKESTKLRIVEALSAVNSISKKKNVGE